MNAIGFDCSLNSSGFAYRRGGEIVTGTIRLKNIKGFERLSFIRDSVLEIIRKSDAELLTIEGYAMGYLKGKSSMLYDRAEITGIIKMLALDSGMCILIVPPTSLKAFATGNGRADKSFITVAIANRWGYRVTQNDEADAFVLLKMGELYKDKRAFRCLDKKSIDSLKKCEFISLN